MNPGPPEAPDRRWRPVLKWTLLSLLLLPVTYAIVFIPAFALGMSTDPLTPAEQVLEKGLGVVLLSPLVLGPLRAKKVYGTWKAAAVTAAAIAAAGAVFAGAHAAYDHMTQRPSGECVPAVVTVVDPETLEESQLRTGRVVCP